MNKLGINLSIVSWFAAWIILGFKLDLVTYIGFCFFALGLSGLIIFVFVPQVISAMREEE